MSRPLCPLPFTHLFINNAGILNVCCLAYPQYGAKDEFGFPLGDRSILNVGLLSALKSNHLEKMKAMTNEQMWPSACTTCKALEISGQKSRRQIELEANSLHLDGIRTMDLRIGNVCNLACRMCSPFSSIALLEEWSDSEKPPSKTMKDSVNAYTKIDWRNWSEIPEIWNDLLKVSEQVTEINFAGGEPFLNLAHVNYLKNLIESGRSNQIQVSYNTNLTLIPPWLELIIENFKSVKIMVSVDGIGALGEFIRHPLKWNIFETNLARLDRLKVSYGEKLVVAFNTTVQIYNLFGLTDLLDYLSNSAFSHLPRTTVANLLQNPSYFNIANLVPEIKEAAKYKIETYRFKNATQSFDCQTSDFLNTVLMQLAIETAPKNQSAAKTEFQQVTGFYDRKRRQNFATLAPEMASYLLSDFP